MNRHVLRFFKLEMRKTYYRERMRRICGYQRAKQKLTNSDRLTIKQALAAGVPQADLAALLNVHQTTISRVNSLILCPNGSSIVGRRNERPSRRAAA